MTHYYGFSNYHYRGRLARVVSFTDQSRNDCKQLGLISQHDFCCETYENWDKVPKKEYRNDSLGPGITSFDLYTMPYDLAHWMSNIRDDVKLTNVAFPGSHDSGTAQSAEISGPWVRTQAYSIITQLILGIRVFDIRPMSARRGVGWEDDEIWTHHGGFKGESLNRILNCVRLFLQTYQSETVIFVLSHYENVSKEEVKAKIEKTMGQLVIAEGNHIYGLTVGDTRGRLLVVDEQWTERHLGPYGHQGTNVWNEMLEHLKRIDPMPNSFNRFVAALTPQQKVASAWQTPERLARDRGLPGLQSWLLTDDSDKIGIVETDWFGRCDEVVDIVKLIVDKNINKGNFENDECISTVV